MSHRNKEMTRTKFLQNDRERSVARRLEKFAKIDIQKYSFEYNKFM